MGQILSLDEIISSLDYNSEGFIEDEGEVNGPCAFNKIFTKNVPHILETSNLTKGVRRVETSNLTKGVWR